MCLCSLLKNMFDPAEETDPNWDSELRDDVAMEAGDKYGKVVDIFVLKDSQVRIRQSSFQSVPSDSICLPGYRAKFT